MKFNVPVSPFVGTIQGQDDVVFSLVNLAPAGDIRLKVPGGGAPADRGAPHLFPFERACNGATLTAALADPQVERRDLNEALIRHVYAEYLKLGPDEKPTSEAKASANRVLMAGRWQLSHRKEIVR